MIDKDTLLFGSFAQKAGSTGCVVHNAGLLYAGINAVYKPFAVEDISAAFEAAKTLGFSGFSVSRPFKVAACLRADRIDPIAELIGATNTILLRDGKFEAYNTDYLAAQEVLQNYLHDGQKDLVILGNGGYASAVMYVAETLGFNWRFLTRQTLTELAEMRNCIVFNCTPVQHVVHESCRYIDCDPASPTGRHLAFTQARYQFKLYTGQEYPAELGVIASNGYTFEALVAWYADRSGCR